MGSFDKTETMKPKCIPHYIDYLFAFLITFCFFTTTWAQQIQVEGVAGDGIYISDAEDDGIQLQDCKYGTYIVNPTLRGVWVVNAGTYGGYFTNASTSTDPALYADQGYGDYPDLFLGGYRGIIAANQGVEINLDYDDNSIGDESFTVNGPGFTAMYVTEMGDASFVGNLSKGSGSFKIDHPVDPANKYLYHSFVESPDMMNVYNGNVILDTKGEASVEMAGWLEALNRDFRYQLTPIGAPGPNLYVAQEMKGNLFRIAGGKPGMKVSWQVTGIRQDPFANENRITVEKLKEDFNRGKYLHPRAWEKVKGLTGLESVTMQDRSKVTSKIAEGHEHIKAEKYP